MEKYKVTRQNTTKKLCWVKQNVQSRGSARDKACCCVTVSCPDVTPRITRGLTRAESLAVSKRQKKRKTSGLSKRGESLGRI